MKNVQSKEGKENGKWEKRINVKEGKEMGNGRTNGKDGKENGKCEKECKGR